MGNTLVLMGDGTRKRIDEIVVGDYVLSVGEHDIPLLAESLTSGDSKAFIELPAPIPQRVSQIFVHENKQVLRLVIDEEAFNTTSIHRFFVVSHGWIHAEEFEVGDIVVSADGKYRTVMEKQYLLKLETVYNLEVEESHTFFVGESDVWVHNRKTPKM